MSTGTIPFKARLAISRTRKECARAMARLGVVPVSWAGANLDNRRRGLADRVPQQATRSRDGLSRWSARTRRQTLPRGGFYCADDGVPVRASLAGDGHEVVDAKDRRHAIDRQEGAGERIIDIVAAAREQPIGQGDIQRELHRVRVQCGLRPRARHGFTVSPPP